MSVLTLDDVSFEATRSGGPGGQHGDRRSTSVRLRVEIDDIPVDDDQKEDLREHLPPRCKTKDDELIIENSDSRSQRQNRKNALRRANEVIDQALERARSKREKERRRRRSRNKSGGGGGERDIKEELKKRRRSETTDDLLEQAFRQDPETIKEFLEGRDQDDTETEGE